MFDKELLDTVIAKWLDGRSDTLSQLEEMNSFTKEESDKFNANTNKVEELRNEIANNEYVNKNDYILLAADFDNYKKRVAKSEQHMHDKAYEDVITRFLRIYDDLERTVTELDKSQTQEQKMFEAYTENPLHTGIRLTFENFEKTLNSLGCEKLVCNYGNKFDFNTMEAISTREIKNNEDYEQDDVVDIYQSGWKMNGKVIRPAKVIVGK